MIEILPLEKLDAADIEHIITDHTTQECYRVEYSDSATQSAITLELVPLAQPHVARYHHFDAAELVHLNDLISGGYALGAYENGTLHGFVIAEVRTWNDSLWVWEYHVAGSQRGKGTGRRLMEALVEKARSAGLRTVICETQNTNVSAIKVYRKLGFRMEGIDISYYTNTDYPDRDVAVFMKRRL
jgi:GNAT superfamily N-acetyltransferase